MKKSQGISLITLVITIAVILILIGMSIFNGLTENIDSAENTMNYNEIFEVSEAIAQRALLNKLNPNLYGLVGEVGKEGKFTIKMEEKSGDETKEVERTFYTNDGWYKIAGDEHVAKLNLQNVKREYLVNYETNEVISIKTIYYENNPYHLASDLRDALGGGGDVVVSVSGYDELKGVNKPYLVKGMIPVKRKGSDWVVTNADDIEWYDYASISGDKGNLWANIMLMDEITVAGMTNEQVRNTSLSDLEGRIVSTEGSMYVWIPRYSRDLVDSEIKIVYSKLTEDFFKDSTDPDNTVLEAFKDDGVELTGIWVSKYDAGFIK